MDADSLLHKLAETLADVQAETFGDRLGDVDAEALLKTMPDTLLDLKAKHLDTH